MKGIVTKSTGSWFTVKPETGPRVECKLKGRFRIQGLKATNPVAVGDRVLYEFLETEGIGVIYDILPRNNYIIRRATNLSKVFHIIAANIDRAYLIVTLASPRTSTGFIDRFLVTTEAYHIPATIVFNKIDIYDDQMQKYHDQMAELYTSIGYECIAISALRGDNLGKFIDGLKNRTNLFAGHSGVGKTALINAIDPELDLKTGKISSVHQKGMHTTTFAEMYELPLGGYIIDTPGIKEMGLIDLDKATIAERFPEMRALMHQCHFHNCTHIHEPGCAVKDAVEAGTINAQRYSNYIGILNDEGLEIEDWNL
ncbi:MAG TPA: ribosome small subunit-dependent GTPase A [Bacteroidales bacterium]|nr:ribosome small subunit-dependent GTPase A [Bacteroidales bacterium]HPT03544.1 ribosome small subunit-dependent GTPase A [Bacteroidales bacterium]